MKLNKRDLVRAFRAADRSGTGGISFTDFLTTYIDKIVPKRKFGKSKVTDAFLEGDIGGKGFLNVGEFYRVMGSLGHYGDEVMMNKLMEKYAKCLSHGEKGMGYGEYCQLMGVGVK